MDTSKLYETCTIKRRTVSTANGEQTFAETEVFSNIGCYIRPIRNPSIVESTTEQRSIRSIMVTVDKAYATIAVADIVVISAGRYQVDEVKAFGLIASANVRLKCTLI